MPYINLNNSKINYQYSIGNDLFIVSGIVDSSCSYKSPKVIRSRKELDIYFGKSFKERGYFEELLDSGVSLLLYKPISTETKESFKVPEKEEVYLCFSEFPKVGQGEILYIDSYTQERYIWNSELEEYININQLPENIYSLENYESWYNRDTLRICSTEEINVSKKEAEIFLKGKAPLENVYSLRRGINNNPKDKAVYISEDLAQGIIELGKSNLSDFLPENIVSPWEISWIDLKEVVIAPPENGESVESSSNSSSSIKLDQVYDDCLVLDLDFPEYQYIQITYTPDNKDTEEILLDNRVLGKSRIIFKNKISNSENSEFDYLLSTSELKSLSFLLECPDYYVYNRAWLAGYFHIRKKVDSDKDKLIIHNATEDQEPTIFLKKNSRRSRLKSTEIGFSLRKGLNYIDKGSIQDLYSGINMDFYAILETGEELPKATWYKGLSLIETIQIISGRKDISIKDLSKIVIYDNAYEDIIIQNTLLSCYPRYKSEYPWKIDNNISLIKNLNINPGDHQEIIESQRVSAFTLDLSEVNSFSGNDGLLGYLCFPVANDHDQKALIWFNDGSNEVPLAGDIVKEEYRFKIDYDPDTSNKEDLIQNILLRFEECGYFSKELDENDVFIVYTETTSVLNLGFSNINGLRFSANLTVTHDILSQVSENYKRLEFYSKTIGPSDENIRIKIEEIPYYSYKYRITVSRFNYMETFDVNLFDVPDKDGNIQSLDHIINRNSRLVECKLFREKSDGTLWKPGDLGGELQIGEWELKRSYRETSTVNMYWEAIHALSEIEVKEDFLCIPEVEYYLKQEESYEDLGYFPEYLDFLKYSKNKNCQVLIGNLNFGVTEEYPGLNENPIERMIYKSKDKYQVYWNGEYRNLELRGNENILRWKNTFIYNYNKDYDNRLVYFYRDMSLDGYSPRPAYYMFLRGILGDTYLASTSEINYVSPLENAFISEEYEKAFELKKTNYMVCDDQRYFYKNFQNHPGNGLYTTTILTRFSMSKVSRALQNNKWDFLGKQLKSEIRTSIEAVLKGLTAKYSIYKNISLVDFQMNHSKNSLIIRIKLYLRELVDKPIDLDVELNYIY